MHLEKIGKNIFLVALATWITGFVELYLWGLQEAETVQQKPSWGWAGPKFALDSSDSSVWIYRMHCKKMQNTFWVAYVEVHCNVSREGIHGKPRDSGYRKGETGACDSLHFAATMWLAWVKHWDSLSRTRLQHMFACNVSLLSVWTLAFKDVETGSTESKSPGCMKASPVKRRGCPMAAWCSYIL